MILKFKNFINLGSFGFIHRIKQMLQFGLLIGVVLVWLPTIYNIVSIRIAMGESWLPMAVILWVVIVFSVWSAWAVRPIHRAK